MTGFGRSILDREQVELAQAVYRAGLAFALDVPEHPAVAARRVLQRLADAVDRARLSPAGDRAVGAHGRLPAPLLVEDLGARLEQAGLDQLAERNARCIPAALHRR